MLTKLVISQDEHEGTARKRGIFATATSAVLLIVVALTLQSLFSHAFGVSGDELNISKLLAPTAVAESPAETPESQSADQQTTSTTSERVIVQSTEASPYSAPEEVRTVRTSIPTSGYKSLGERKSGNDGGKISGARGKPCNDCGTGSLISGKKEEVKKPKKPEAPTEGPPKLKEKKVKIVRRAVVNGIARNLVVPKYPRQFASVVGTNQVTVEVLISETGRVISAKATKGHPLLRRSAVAAARRSTFTPTRIGNTPVKVKGLIIYRFKR